VDNPIVIFHSPVSLDRQTMSGGTVRPKSMLNAFRECGADIFLIDGDSRQRREKWQALLHQSETYLGVYSELSTMPIALTDPDRNPRHPFMDMAMFRAMRRSGVPVSAFYRDIYWRFWNTDSKGRSLKRTLSIPFYHLELFQARKSLSHLYLPSMRMQNALPLQFPETMVSSLPPGGNLLTRSTAKRSTNTLNLLYVGGVRPPTYDLSQMFEVVRAQPRVSLTACCREKEWREVSGLYPKSNNIRIVHENGAALRYLYEEADLFLMFRELVPYLQFAMPVKLFEATGAGVPIVTNTDCEMGDFVEANHIGWTVPHQEHLTSLLQTIVENPGILEAKRRNVLEVRQQHTWKSRAEQVLSDFESLKYQMVHPTNAYLD